MEKETLRLLDDRVCVKRDEAADKIGSIYIPQAARKKPECGVVTGVSAAKHLANGLTRKLDVAVGDRIIFQRYAGSDRGGSLLIREDDVIGVVDGDELKLLQDRVVIKQDAADTMYGKLHLPEEAHNKPKKGVIRFVGPGLRTKKGGFWPMDSAIAVGAHVIYHVYAGQEIELFGEELLVMRAQDLHAVEVDDAAA